MKLRKLQQSAKLAIEGLNSLLIKTPESSALINIKNQLEFIKNKSSKGLDPRAELPKATVFSFGIVSSRELNSPNELELKALIDAVADELDSE